MALSPFDALEQLQTDFPDLSEDIQELANLHQRKLWHQLTLKIEACFHSSAFNRGDIPVRLFQQFIMDFGHKINFLKLSQFAVHACKFQPNPAAAVDMLQSVMTRLEELKQPRTAEAILFLRMHVAQHKLETGHVQECKAIAEDVTERLAKLTDVDPSVSSAVYYVTSLYHKSQANYADFYRSILMYLSYVSSDSLQPDFKLRLAVDVSLAALLGEHIYSFGQLLQHPIINSLDCTPSQWLHELLVCFNNGDMHLYDQLCERFAAQLNSQPALVAHERRLREKITLMCLLDLISSTPAEHRRIPLDVIGQRTKLNRDGVEFLLMKALALHLIEGTIDEVDGAVDVSWVTPRVLVTEQLVGLKGRLDSWVSKVAAVAAALEDESVGVMAVGAV
ncbi:26S proteasome regulatory complex [Volvox carteri f. nagariensis]|uniref:26S proteasome regulatory complex n=1 Tax=Volvox carteri f. nagariensis TaxID=3068 RepID=D8U1H0_VOLCA|nr:26S proteasome regulatory complex [Volvox carteri f. nagariensis]EFJ46340.1 26S proteasome regulatory complex [Volvox carteri f. nagariensis]|eukprot:XP_002952493.1 26S proteasome regulatory complex [Volvox carteri f. nagariensis]